MRDNKQYLSRARQAGQGMVEFAISLVFLMILVVGIMEGGRALFTYMGLRDAAQEGALYGSIAPEDTYGITTRVTLTSDMTEELVSSGTLQVQISYTDTGNTPKVADGNPATADICLGDGIIVTVTFPDYNTAIPFIFPITFDMAASISDTVLQPLCP